MLKVKIVWMIMFSVIISNSYSQGIIDQSLDSFDKLVISPFIDVVLIQGDEEKVSIEFEGVAEEKINVRQNGSTVKIFLDGARLGLSNEKLIDPDDPTVLIRRSRYHGARLTAYVTFSSLRKINVRGDGSLNLGSTLAGEKLKLKLMGEIEAEIESVDTKKLVVSSFGNNRVRINQGAADRLRFRLWGETYISTSDVISANTKVSNFGESKVELRSEESVRVRNFGESEITYVGNAKVSKSLAIGETIIKRANKWDHKSQLPNM